MRRSNRPVAVGVGSAKIEADLAMARCAMPAALNGARGDDTGSWGGVGGWPPMGVIGGSPKAAEAAAAPSVAVSAGHGVSGGVGWPDGVGGVREVGAQVPGLERRGGGGVVAAAGM